MNCDDLNNFLNKSDFKTEEDALTSLKEIEELVKNDKQLLLQTIRFFRRKGFANSIEMLLNTFHTHTHIDCEYIIKLKMENAMWARHYVKVKTYADELVDSPKFNMDANIALGYYYINDNNFIDAYNIINDKLKLRDICDEINQSNSSKNSNGYNKEAAKLYIYYLKKIACEEKKILRVSLRFLAEFKDAYFLNAMIDYFISSNGLDKLSQIINEYVYLIPEGTTKTEIILKYKIITNDHLSFKNYIEDFYKLTNIQGLIKIIDFINKIKCFTDTNNFANCILEFIFEKIEDLTELPVKELEFIYEFSIDFNYVKLATLIEEFLESNFKHLNLDERNTISTVYMSYYLEQIYNYCFDKDIKLSIWIYPLLSRIDNLTAFEKSLSSKFYTKRNFNRYQYDYFNDLMSAWNPDKPQEYYKSLCQLPRVIKHKDNSLAFEDYRSECFTTENGFRSVKNKQPGKKYSHRVILMGSCIGVGLYSDDYNTIPSKLQKLINNSNYEVINCSFPAAKLYQLFSTLKNLNLNKDDHVILIPPYLPFSGIDSLKSLCIFNKIPFVDLSEIFNSCRYKYGPVFADKDSHLTPSGNQLIADTLYNVLFNTQRHVNRYRRLFNLFDTDNINSSADYDFLKLLENKYKSVPRFSNSKIGAIVMNCNPMTNGHLHLISLASKLVNHLYIFIVEEDKSFFKFEDRISLVKSVCEHNFNNVHVCGSGSFMISSETFPEYFSKDTIRDVKVDVSNDLNIFCKYVCSYFNISIRFAGEEPLDPITMQYNNAMRRILPGYGIQFIEIPRLSFDSDIVSASRVRSYLKENKFHKIKKLVPKEVFDFLISSYSRKHKFDNLLSRIFKK